MLEVVIFVSGALVMVLEMVGARVMAPHLGTSAIVWTSIIGVVLACLACGAWMGGRLADKKLSRSALSAILAGAGAGCGLTSLVHSLVGDAVAASVPDIHLAAVTAATALFALPATLFGMTPPYVIRLRLADIATSGATVGRLYALSTTGSILGAFLGGFVLVSWFSSTQILLGVGACMTLLSLLTYAPKAPLRLALLLGFSAAAMGTGAYDAWLVDRGTPPTVETPYNSIRIMDARDRNGRPVRLMATDPGYMQSGMYLDNPAELYFEYTKYYALGTALFPQAVRVLMLGGGGCSVPKWLLAGHGGLDEKRLRIDVVELDPGMTRVARKYFALPEDSRLRLIHEDARRFINANAARYDLVFVDVFNSHYSVPFHMGTVEAAAALRGTVAPGGALLMNVISAVEGDDGRLFRAIYGALKTAFPELHVFAVNPGRTLTEVQNLMVLAFPEARPDLAPILTGSAGQQALMRGMPHGRLSAAISDDIPPLRDDFAPVERYAQALLKR